MHEVRINSMGSQSRYWVIEDQQLMGLCNEDSLSVSLFIVVKGIKTETFVAFWVSCRPAEFFESFLVSQNALADIYISVWLPCNIPSWMRSQFLSIMA